MSIGSPPITWDLKHTGEPYIGTPQPNPSGNTGVMVCFDQLIPSKVVLTGLIKSQPRRRSPAARGPLFLSAGFKVTQHESNLTYPCWGALSF